MPVFVAHTKKKEKKKKENKCHVCNKEPYLQASLCLLYLDWSFCLCSFIADIISPDLLQLRRLKVGAAHCAGSKMSKFNRKTPVLISVYLSLRNVDLLWGSYNESFLSGWYLVLKSILGFSHFKLTALRSDCGHKFSGLICSSLAQSRSPPPAALHDGWPEVVLHRLKYPRVCCKQNPDTRNGTYFQNDWLWACSGRVWPRHGGQPLTESDNRVLIKM